MPFKKIKSILINAPVAKVVEEYDEPPYPHYALGNIATYGIKNGLDCRVIDCKFEKINLKKLLSLLSEYQKEDQIVFGFTAMTNEINQVIQTAQKIKEMFPASRIVIGGVHISALPEETMKEFDVLDIGVINEGEKTFVELLEALRTDKPLIDIDGLVYRNNGKIVCTKSRSMTENIDELGYPDWSLFPKAEEYHVNIIKGCPIPCNFCMRASGTKYRFRSVDSLIEEITIINKNYSPRLVNLNGEDFVARKDFANSFLNSLINLKPKIKWRATMRVTNITSEIIKKIKVSGCIRIEIGVETGNEKILKAVGKGISLKKVQEVVKMAKNIDLDCWCFFILGHPNETWKTVMDTINFMCKLNPTNVAIGIMVPYPGTKIWEMALKGESGYHLLSRNWKDFNKQIGNALELKSLSRSKLEFLQFYGYIKLFISNYRFIDFSRFCWEYRMQGLGFLENFFLKFFKKKI